MEEKWLIRNDTVEEAGFLYYNTVTKEWRVEITNFIDLIPGFLILSRLENKPVLSPYESLLFIRERIIPPNRCNIQQILADNNMPYYDEYFFIKIGNGKCVMDDFYFVPLVQRTDEWLK